MSNSVWLIHTKYQQVGDETGESVSYGFRFNDEYASFYSDGWNEPGPPDNLDFLAHVLADESEDGVRDLMESCRSTETGMFINGQWYDYDELELLIVDYLGP